MDFIATKLICLSKPYRSHLHPKSLKYSTFPGLDFGNLTIVVVGNNKFTTTTTTTTSVGYGLMRLSSRLLSGSILRNPLPEASRNHYCPVGGEINHAMWLR